MATSPVVDGVSVAVDETSREVSQRRVVPGDACARGLSNSGR
jgi:hypothetical protein